MNFLEMDKNVSVYDQMVTSEGPVTLMNQFTVDVEEADALVAAWAEDAAFMKRQPGFISTQLHRGIAGSCVFMNVAVWESVEHFKRAFTQPEFQAHLGKYPLSTVASPHLFSKLAVPGICVA